MRGMRPPSYRESSFVVTELVRVWKEWEGEFRCVQNLTISATVSPPAELKSKPKFDPSLRQEGVTGEEIWGKKRSYVLGKGWGGRIKAQCPPFGDGFP